MSSSEQNEEYLDLLRLIDRTASSLTKWEAGFVESVLKKKPILDKIDKEVIDRMAKRYLGT